MNYIIVALLFAVAAYDIFLSIGKEPTLSQQYQKLFSTWKDMIILGVALTALCFAEFIHPAIRIWIAGVLGHICWPNKETYKQ